MLFLFQCNIFISFLISNIKKQKERKVRFPGYYIRGECFVKKNILSLFIRN